MGLLVGSPFWGTVSGKSRSALTPTLYGCLLCIIVIIGMNLQIKSVAYFSILFFIIGFSSAAQIISYSVIMKFNSDNSIGTAEGLITWLILALGGIAQPLSGWIIEFGAVNNISDLEVFSILIWILVFALVISLNMYYILDSTLKKTPPLLGTIYDNSVN